MYIFTPLGFARMLSEVAVPSLHFLLFHILPAFAVTFFNCCQSYGWRRQWHPTPVLFPGKSHGPRSLVGCSPWGREESDTTEQLHFQFSLSCIGEGNGNPLQCSCLENPRDGGAWWAAVYGVAQSRTRLKRLSSSSLMDTVVFCFDLHFLVFVFTYLSFRSFNL